MTTATLIDVPMPPMGVAVTEGTVVRWHVAVGDRVEVDQPICDIATDKVDTEVVSSSSGVVAEIVAAEGDAVPTGAPLLRLSAGGDAPPPEGEPGPEAGGSAVPGEAPGSSALAPAAGADENGSTPKGGTTTPAGGAPGGHASDALAGAVIDVEAAADAPLSRPGPAGVPLSSPVARRHAAERGIDLATVRGTGRGGRIRKADVLAAGQAAPAPQALAAAPAPPEAAAATPPASPATAPPPTAPAPLEGLPRGYDDVPHEIVATSHQRRAISEHMIRSRQTAAHMTTEVEVDMHRVSLVRRELNAERETAGRRRVSFLSFIARAAIAALAKHPELNATFQHERSIHWQEVNLGIAVDTPGGLIVPVIRGAERLTVGALADAIADLGGRARTRRLKPDDLRAGTFTISNPGSVGAVSAPAILNQPQVAILGTPAIVKRPWVVTMPDGTEAIVPRPIMKLALTFDHRAVDGADATRYVVLVKDHLETWDAQAYR